ncbi:Mitochondrial substrate/solute carrier [Parasponia andersonii]|uniref:ADP/ATP translocase n=1 Tax=Parasponia andersonii TaxID=3476 RepID=A0A2P5AE73_PARAD|nr:Mitochondrial substrate/solute carrier [Parasponia andersonii]
MEFNGLIDVYKKTLNSDSIAGLPRGFGVSCLGTIVHAGVFSVTYASLVPLIFGFKLLQL